MLFFFRSITAGTASTAAGPRPRRRKLPRVFWQIADQPAHLDNVSWGSTVNMGYAQMRGRIAASRLGDLEHDIGQGAPVRGFTEDGAVVWEGRISQPPKVNADGTADVAAQGNGIVAFKTDARVVGSLTAPGAWVPANSEPLNWQFDPAIETTAMLVVNNGIERYVRIYQSNLGFGDYAAMAFWAPKMELSRFKATIEISKAGDHVVIYTADGPDIFTTARAEYAVDTNLLAATSHDVDITFRRPGDVIIIENRTGNPDSGDPFNQILVYDPIVYGDYAYDLVTSKELAATCARILDWDRSGITGRGIAAVTPIDNADSPGSMLDYLSNLEDARWCAWADEGRLYGSGTTGTVLDYGRWGQRVWTVSAATGARWSLDPLELYNAFTVKYLVTELQPVVVRLTADGFTEDPLAPYGITNEASIVLRDVQGDRALAEQVAFTNLRRGLEQRYRGNVTFAHAFDESGRDAAYEVRAGDVIRIPDFDPLAEALELRVYDVSCNENLVTVGIEASALPALGADPLYAGGDIRNQRFDAAAIPAVNDTEDGTAAYVAPESPASGGSSSGTTSPWYPGPNKSGGRWR